MLSNANFLILDEPTVGLDPEERIHFRNLFSRTAQDRLVLLSTHIIEDVQSVCDRLVVIDDGTIPFQGTPREVFQHGDELEHMGLGVPQLTRVFHRLRAMGADVDPSVYTLEQAKAALLAKLGKNGKGAV